MRIWLLGARDASIDLRGAREVGVAARWRAYAESYVLKHATELVDTGRLRRPFLLR